MISPRLNPSLPPNFHEMDEYAFQEMCRDLFAEESEIVTCDIYGTRGQPQGGIDLLAHLNNNVCIAVGQCKCYKKFLPRQIREASDEFFKHINYWQQQGVKRFILFVACELTKTQHQEEILIQKQRFVEHEIRYEVWTAHTLRQKLSPHPAIAYRYLRSQDLVEAICGRIQSPISPSSDDARAKSIVIDSLIFTIARLSSDLSKAKARQLEKYRERYREGKFQEAFAMLEALRNDEHWNSFDKALQAQILQSLAGYALGVEQDVEKAKRFADQAQSIEPTSTLTVIQVLIRYHAEGAKAALALIDIPSSLDLYNLKIGLLLELGQVDEVLVELQNLAQVFVADSETNRIHALALLDKGDIAGAQVKIQQARYDNPTWEKVRATEATINYFSVISPISVLRLIDQPPPVEWWLIKRDDESLGRLRTAAAEFKQLAAQTERGDQQRCYWQIWHLACLANDPDSQAEAQAMCQELLAHNPTHPQAIAWGMMRGYEIDTATSQQVLETLLHNGSQDLEHIITLLGLYLQLCTPNLALDLLKAKQQVFEQQGHHEVWQFWFVQALSFNGDFEQALEAVQTFQAAEVRRRLQVMVLREQGRLTNEWQTLSEYLEAYWQESGNTLYLYEACQLQARLQNWNYIVDRADMLVTSVATSEALSLVAQAAWQAGRAERCYQLLNDHLQVFPNRVLPPYLRQLKTKCQARLGLISEAIASAEELVRSQETAENLVMLMNLQANQGDLRGVARTATCLLRNEQTHPIALLQAARYLLSEDVNLSQRLWRRAVTAEIDVELLGEVITLGFNLELDQEIQPFLHRAQILALSEEGLFQAVAVHELLEQERSRRTGAEDVNIQYDNAELPIHLIAQRLSLSLTRIFQTLLEANVAEPNPLLQTPILIRYGARLFPQFAADSIIEWRLHLDVSALLLAAELDILDIIERRFSPLRISPTLPVALLQECNCLIDQQPSRITSYREILRLHRTKQVKSMLPSLTLNSGDLLEQLNEQTAILLEQAHIEDGFVVEFLPLGRLNSNGTFQPAVLEESDQQRFINSLTLVETLKTKGILSTTAYQSVLSSLGDQQDVISSQRPNQNDALFVNSELVNLLAGSGILSKVCRYFRVFVSHECIDEAQAFVSQSEAATETIRSLRELMRRISDGLQQGRYEMIVEPMAESEPASEARQLWDTNGLTAYDLFTYQPQDNDVIWIDDRFFSKYPRQDRGVPIIGILEVLEALRVSQDLEEPIYYDKILQLRKGNVRYISITSREVLYHLKQAQVENGKLQETEELTILRRYVAACLLDSHRLQRPPMRQDSLHPDGEMPFVFECFRATLDAICEIWMDERFSEGTAAAYSDWILFNLYTGMFGTRHLLLNQDPESDGLDVLSNDICILYFRGIGMWHIDEHSRYMMSERRQAYFVWLERRVIEKRFRANPEIIPAIAQLIRETILHLGVEENLEEMQSILHRSILKQFYRDLPALLQAELDTDPELKAYLQIETVESINLSLLDSNRRLTFLASDFLPAIATAVSGGEAEITTLNLEPERTFRVQAVQQGEVTLQLHFTDLETTTVYAWHDDITLLTSDNPTVRERVLRANSAWFDCDRSTYESAINEIVATTDLRRRIDQANQWRKASAECFYRSLQQRLHQEQDFTAEDLIPPSGARLLQHFHLKQSESVSFEVRLEHAVASMLEVYDLATCIERFSCLPTKLPQPLKEAFINLPSVEQGRLLQQLASQLISPVCRLHLLDLALCSSVSNDFAPQILDTLLSQDGELQFRLFQAILNLVDKEFSYWQEVREWTSSNRLAITWAHSSKLYNLLYDTDVDIEAFIRELSTLIQVRQTSADILDRNPDFWNDVLYPRRLNRFRFIAYGIGAISQEYERSFLEAIGIVQELTEFSTTTVEDQPILNMNLWHDDYALAQDSLGALWGGSRYAILSIVFRDEFTQQVTSENLRSVVEDAIDALATEPTARSQWYLLIAIVGDLPIYPDLIERLDQLVSSTSFVKLYEAEPTTAFFALRFVCDHVANTANEELRIKLEAELIAIAKLVSVQEQSTQNDHEISDQLLECALKVAVRANDPRATSTSINHLLEKIALAWSQFSNMRSEGFSLILLDLPAIQLQGAWATTLRFRGLHGY
jgi:hypothetical protein